MAAPVSWKLTDAADQPVADVPVAVAVSTGGSVEPVSVSDPSGIVQLPSWTLSSLAGEQYVDLEVPGAGVSRVTVEAVADAPASLEKFSGDGQSAPVNDELPEPLVVRLLDQYGNGVNGMVVEWRTCEDEGGYNTSTDSEGYASAFQPTGPTPGVFCAKAISGVLTVQFTYTVTGTEPAPPTPGGVRAMPPASARQKPASVDGSSSR
jgi:hypothetical protein